MIFFLELLIFLEKHEETFLNIPQLCFLNFCKDLQEEGKLVEKIVEDQKIFQIEELLKLP